MMYKSLLKKIKSKKINICIIGLGYVGLPIALRFISKGLNIFGIDEDFNKINSLKNSISYISGIKNKDLRYFKKFKNNLSTSYSLIRNVDIIIICLPTPLRKNKTPDMKYVFNCAKKIKKNLNKNTLLVLESTVYPGATEEFLGKIFSDFELIGKDFFVSYSPERENPGDKNFNYKKTPKIVGGFTEKCKKLSMELYSHIVKKVIPVSSIKVAELTKLHENIYRAINIGLVNEMKIISNKLGINIYEVIDAAGTKNFGFQKFYPGPGLGGHCIPIDPFYLSWLSKKNGYEPRLIKTAGEINTKITNQIIKKIIKNLEKKNSKVLIIGVAYKKNTNDDRESPSLKIINELKKNKIKVSYHDPYIDKINKGRNFRHSIKSINLNKNNIIKSDLVVVVTDHDNVNYNLIKNFSKKIIDCRGVFKNDYYSDKIILA